MKPVKALILGLLLLVPILIFIFISVFGTHYFSLKTFYPKLDDRGAVVYNAAGDTVFQQVPFFRLTSQQGESVTQADLDDKLYVAHFFQTACVDSCQEVFSQMLRVQETFENIPQLKLVSISVDPAQDSVQALQQFASRIGVNPEKWYLLTGNKEEVLKLAKDGFHEPVKQQGGQVEQSHRLVLVDKEKQIRGIYEGADKKDVDRLILEINVMLDEYSKRK